MQDIPVFATLFTMYTPTIGLEIHAELLTESKLFCGCKNKPNEEVPNTHICPVCLGYPGALPVLNRRAVEHILRIGTALHGTIAKKSSFDRKHYFYPDIPKGYQISQYPYPFVEQAELAGVGIERVHLEEDTAKSSHDVTTQGSVIDFNRSGVPLMELVTDPVIHTAKQAREFADLLQLTLRYLGVARARMEWGEMRVEVNISISPDETLGTKVEIKNLNSFKSVVAAIDFEINRQTELLSQGKTVAQETRGWNENTGKTFSQRLKETSAEYRYMPEPDLTLYHIDTVPGWDSASLAATIPELPEAKRRRYIDHNGLSSGHAEVLVKIPKLAALFDQTTVSFKDDRANQLTANYLCSDVLQYLETIGEVLFERVTVSAMTELIQLLQAGELSSRGAKDTLAVLVQSGGSPREIAEREGFIQQSDTTALTSMVVRVLEQHPAVADEYRAGKEQVLQFLVGQVMRESRGAANPAIVRQLLTEHL